MPILAETDEVPRRRLTILPCLLLTVMAGCSNPNATTADPNDVWRAVEHAELEANLVSARPGRDPARP